MRAARADPIALPTGARTEFGYYNDMPRPRSLTTPRIAQTTAHDVARLAGVSQSAVSRTFTAGASVSPKTRDRVTKAAEALGYQPNLIARSLSTRQSGIVGVAVAYMDNQFYPELLQALAARLREAGLRILLFSADLHSDADPVLNEVMRYQVDALILASATLSSRLAEECRKAGIPVLLLNRTVRSKSVCSITGDNTHGARLIAAFLKAAGHRNFAYMAGLENSSTNREREGAFREYLIDNGFGPPVRAVGYYTLEGARVAARSLLASRSKPDAIFCANDHMAFATIDVARSEFGLEVGKQVSIVGFDDVPLASWPSYCLTTFSQPIAKMVESAVAALQRLLENGANSERQIVPGELIVRASARLPTRGISTSDGRSIWTDEAI